MENVVECLQCVQLGKRWKDEKAKHDKKKNLISLFKELLYAHDLKLCNFTRTNLRDVYSKYLIDGEQVRQRLAGTLATLNEVSEAYSSTSVNSDAQQKKILDLEGKITHLEFLNKQLSDYYNQVESDNKKPKTEVKASKVKKEKDNKKSGRKQNLKIEIKSDPSSPECNITLDNADFNFTTENSVKNELIENREGCVGKNTPSSNNLEDALNITSIPDLDTTLEEEFLKAKDILESDSDFESNQDTFNFSDQGEPLTELGASILLDTDNLISQLEKPPINEIEVVTSFEDNVISNSNSENINLHETESVRSFHDESGISSYNSSPVNEEEDRNSLCLQDITNVKENCNKNINNCKSFDILENVSEIIESNTIIDVLSPIKTLKKSNIPQTSMENRTKKPLNGNDPKEPEILIGNSKSSQHTDKKFISNDNENMCSDSDGSIDCRVNNKEIDASESNLNLNEKEIENQDLEDDREKVYVSRQCKLTKSKLMPKSKTLLTPSKWAVPDPHLNWVEKLKVHHNEIDCTDICKALKRINLNGKGIVKKKTDSKLKPNLFKTLTSKGLFQSSIFTITPKKWSNFRIFGNLSGEVQNSQNKFTQETSNFSDRNEQVFSFQNNLKNDKCDFSFVKSNINSFYEYRIKTEEDVKFQQINSHNNAPSVTVSFNLLNNDVNNHPHVEEVFKFTLTHPLVHISGLKDRQIMVNSMNDLIHKVKKFSDELEMLNEKFLCVPSNAGDAKYMSNYRESFNSKLPFHQVISHNTNEQNYNFNRLSNYQVSGNNVNSLLMKSNFSPLQASSTWNENANEHLPNYRLSSNLFNLPSLSNENNLQANFQNINVDTAYCLNSRQLSTFGTFNNSSTFWPEVPFPSQSDSQIGLEINSSNRSADKLSNEMYTQTDILPMNGKLTKEIRSREIENTEIINHPEYSDYNCKKSSKKNTASSTHDNSFSRNSLSNRFSETSLKMNSVPSVESNHKRLLITSVNEMFDGKDCKAPIARNTFPGNHFSSSKSESRSGAKDEEVVGNSNLNNIRSVADNQNNLITSKICENSSPADLQRKSSYLKEKSSEINLTSCYKEVSENDFSQKNIKTPSKESKKYLFENKDRKKSEEAYMFPKIINKKCTLNEITSQKITETQLTTKYKKIIKNGKIKFDSALHNDINNVTPLINQESKITLSSSAIIKNIDSLTKDSSGKKSVLKEKTSSFTAENNNLGLISDEDNLRTNSCLLGNLSVNNLNNSSKKQKVDDVTPRTNILKNNMQSNGSVVTENSDVKAVKSVKIEGDSDLKNERFPCKNMKKGRKAKRKKKCIIDNKAGENAFTVEDTKNAPVTFNISHESSRNVKCDSAEVKYDKYSCARSNSETFDLNSKKDKDNNEAFLEMSSLTIIMEEYKSIRPLSPLSETEDFKQEQAKENNVSIKKLQQGNDSVGNLELSKLDDKNLFNRKDNSETILFSGAVNSLISDLISVIHGPIVIGTVKEVDDVSKSKLDLNVDVDSGFPLSDAATINREKLYHDSSVRNVETEVNSSNCNSENNLLSNDLLNNTVNSSELNLVKATINFPEENTSEERSNCNTNVNNNSLLDFDKKFSEKENNLKKIESLNKCYEKLTTTQNTSTSRNETENSNTQINNYSKQQKDIPVGALDLFSHEKNEGNMEELSSDADKLKSFTIKKKQIFNDQPKVANNGEGNSLRVQENISNRVNEEIKQSSENFLPGRSDEMQENNLKSNIVSDENGINVDSTKESRSVNKSQGQVDCILGFYSDNSVNTEVDKFNGMQEHMSKECNLNLDSVPIENNINKSIERIKQTSTTENDKAGQSANYVLDFYRDRSNKAEVEKHKVEGMKDTLVEEVSLNLSKVSNESDKAIKENDNTDESNELLLGFYRDRSDKTEEENSIADERIKESENNALKRKISFTDSIITRKKQRLLAEDEILECKNESAMRTSLRYFVMQLKEKNVNSLSRKRKRMTPASSVNDEKFKSLRRLKSQRIKSLIDSYVDTPGEKHNKLIAILEELSTKCMDVVTKTILEHLVSDKEGIQTLNRIPHLTKVQKRLLMLIISLAHSTDTVYDLVLNSFEETLASFRDKAIDISNGIRVACFYTTLCRSQGFLSRARSLLFDLLYSRGPTGIIIVLKMISTWPFLMPHASFAENCLITKVVLHVLLSTPHLLINKYAKMEFLTFKKNVTTKYGYSNLAECVSNKEELLSQITSRITEKGSGLALLLLTKVHKNPWSSKIVESVLLPYLHNWLAEEKRSNDESTDLIAAEIALSIGRISRGFPKLTCRTLINTIIKTFENMLNKSENMIVIEAVMEALVLMRRHNLQMCTAVIGKWHPKGQFITKKVAALIRLIVAVKPITHWIRFLDLINAS